MRRREAPPVVTAARCVPARASSSCSSLFLHTGQPRWRTARPRMCGGTVGTRRRSLARELAGLTAHKVPAKIAMARRAGMHGAQRWTAAPRLESIGVFTPPVCRPAWMGKLLPTAGAIYPTVAVAIVLSNWRSLRLALRRVVLMMRRRRRSAGPSWPAGEVSFTMRYDLMSFGFGLVLVPLTASSTLPLATSTAHPPPRGLAACPRAVLPTARGEARPATPCCPVAKASGTRRTS